ncbi:polyphenol oxidase family protein [Glaciecola siphonariae]|uniref:Polyphenol oxidase family protein n=1 Tax=Glaciecola siphonariae TaxID=521012 RepID=A0ABV9LYY7_9ALTE
MNVFTPDKPLSANSICFTTQRYGGVSEHPFNTLNLALHVGDDAKLVEANRLALFSWLCQQVSAIPGNKGAVKSPQYITQVHSSRVLNAGALTEGLTEPCDGVFSDQKMQPLVILTADCMPIVIMSTVSSEFCAIHAGWKGLANGIVENALTKFSDERRYLRAWIGPSICQKHFEVGRELTERFDAYKAFFYPGNPSKWHMNLSGIATHILTTHGVTEVQSSDECTYCHDALFSYRQASHLNIKDCGRMATIAMRY